MELKETTVADVVAGMTIRLHSPPPNMFRVLEVKEAPNKAKHVALRMQEIDREGTLGAERELLFIKRDPIWQVLP